MNERMLRDLLKRVRALERQMPRLRVGEVTGVGPLDVSLGGSDVPYEDVKSVQGVASGDRVAALLAGNDLIVLGAVGDGSLALAGGTATATYGGGSQQSAETAAISHTLSGTPRVWTQSLGINHFTRPASVGASTFTVRARTLDGTSPVAATTVDFYWLAVLF